MIALLHFYLSRRRLHLIQLFSFRMRPLCAVVFSVAVMCAARAQGVQAQKEAVAQKTSHAQPADVSGDWQVSWEGRLGTAPGTLHLQQDGKKLTGTFKDLHGLSSLSGTIDENRISFDVQFQGAHPFTTRFVGNANGEKIEGTSQAVNVGERGAFLGHGGEVVNPEHPWKAKRGTATPGANQATSGEIGAKPSPPANK
jgi:hypothetical protein